MIQTVELDSAANKHLDKDHIEICESGLFDSEFYLAKYPDIKKSTWNALAHFVQHGAYEYRWPNAHFDPIYYLKIFPHAYAANFLIHYLRFGQAASIPTQASQSVSYWRVPEIIAKPCRSFLFCLLCILHSLRRHSLETAINYDHQFSTLKFLSLSLSRFQQGCGSQVKLTTPSYLTQSKRLEQPESYGYRILSAPIAFAYLYLANVLKIQGFFADAMYLLHKLANHPQIQDLALCSLGDLLLVEATWADEFKDYEEEGIVINLFRQWQKFAGKTMWHEQTFEKALSVLRKALAANDKNRDMLWLLCYGLLAAGKYSDVLEILKNYPSEDSEIRERNIIEARAKYGIDRSQGLAARQKFLPPGDENWYMTDLDLVNVADVPASAVQEHICALKPVQLPIESKIVRDLELIVCKNILQFGESYLSRFKEAEILPEYGIVVAEKKLFIKESCHMKLCHASLFNSCIQEISNGGAFIFASSPLFFEEENCIYLGCNNNYYHWLIDELPRLSLIEANKLFEDAPILVDKRTMSWQYDLLSRLGIENKRLRKIDFRQPISFRNLIVPSRLSRDMIAHPQAVSFMRKKLLGNFNGRSATKGKRIYVTRTAHATTGRIMLNERDIIDKFKRANFQIIDPAQLSIQEQIELFGDAEIIAGPVGAGLTNMLFAPEQARILDLGASQLICETYTSLASAIGQESWSVRGASYARPYTNLIWTNFDYEINEKDIDFCFNYIL